MLTIAAPGQRLTPKEKRLLSDVEIIEIRSPFDRTATRSESQLRTQGEPLRTDDAYDSKKRSTSSRKPGIVSNALRMLDRQFPTDTWLLLFAAKYPELLRVMRQVQPDVIWCTADPWSGLEATRWLAEGFKVPWVADFRDPWTISELRTAGQWPISRKLDTYFERKILKSADAVIFQTASVEEAYHQRYPDLDFQSHVITNSFDPYVFDDPIKFQSNPVMPVSEADGLHLGFFGRFRAMSPATVIIDALAAVRRRSPAIAARIFVHSFGTLNEADRTYAEEHGVLEAFVTEGAVPLEASLGVLRKFDLLLVSTDIRRREIIPAKIFEYLAAGRPILSLSRNTEVGYILERTGTGLQLDALNPDEVADFLIRSLEAVDEYRPMPIPFTPKPEAISRYEARETTSQLASVLEGIAAEKSSVTQTTS